jgi:hypothetical protein
MELFAKLFSSLLVFVYHCFDRIVIHGYLSGLSRPEQVVYLFRDVVGVPVVDKTVLSKRTGEYRGWVGAFARNHKIPMEWAQKGVRKEDYVRPWLRRMERAGQYGVYVIFQSMEQGPTFRCSMPKFPTQDPNHRILRAQRSRFTHYYFYLRDETLGPMVMRVASFFPFQATYYLNGHSFIEQELNRNKIGFRKNDNAFLAVEDVAALQATADRLTGEVIGERLDDESAPVLRRQPDRVLPQFHLQAPLPHPPHLRTLLRDWAVAADRAQDQRDLRRPRHQEAEGQTQHHAGADRARASHLPRLFQTRLREAIREVLHLPAQ